MYLFFCVDFFITFIIVAFNFFCIFSSFFLSNVLIKINFKY